LRSAGIALIPFDLSLYNPVNVGSTFVALIFGPSSSTGTVRAQLTSLSVPEPAMAALLAAVVLWGTAARRPA
jgi:hypothetical protein